MTRWNPNDPSIIGPEFAGAYDSTLSLRSLATQPVQRFHSNAAETIAGLRLRRSVRSLGDTATYLVEIHAAGDEVDADPTFTVDTFAPNALTVVGGVTNQAGAAANVSNVDEWPPDLTDYFLLGSPQGEWRLQFATAAVAPTGRVVSVAVEVVTPLTSGASSQRSISASLRNGGTEYGAFTQTVPVNDGSGNLGRAFLTWGEINPITNLPWTQADLSAIDTATTEIVFRGNPGGRWAAIRLVVVYEDTERRLAVGSFSESFERAAGWTSSIPLYTPAGVANWAKADATDYALVVRRAAQGGFGSIMGADLSVVTLHAAAGDEPPADLPSSDGVASIVSWLVDGGASLSGQAIIAQTAASGRLLPFVLRTTAPATSADGQPYSTVRTVSVYDGAGATQQEVQTSSTDVYNGLRLMVGWGGDQAPREALTVAVKRRVDNAPMGTFTIPVSAVEGLTEGVLAAVEVYAPDPGFTLTTGFQYYLDLSSTTPFVLPWAVGLLAVNGGAGGVTYQEATYNGGTDLADPIEGTAATALTFTPADLAGILSAAIDPPSGLEIDAALEPLPDSQPCGLAGIPYASLGWDPTSLGADFGRYELERLGTDGVTWQLIASIDDEPSDGFDDYEARLGLEESYRLRVVRSDGAASYYTDVETVTLNPAGCGYTFTSNEAPAASVGYPDTYDGRAVRTYDFPEAGEVDYRVLFGRDNVVAFHPLSRRGVRFDRRLVIGGFAAPAAGVGPPAAALLRDLVWASLPYVCVRDNDGNRWFASVRVPDESAYRYRSTHVLWVTVFVVEVTATPYPSPTGTNSPGGPLEFISGEPILFVDGDPMDAVT